MRASAGAMTSAQGNNVAGAEAAMSTGENVEVRSHAAMQFRTWPTRMPFWLIASAE